MCPACVASAALAVTGAIATVGLRALFVKILAAKNGATRNAKNLFQNPNPKEETWVK